MATEELKVRFKVDTSEVKQGADEAKNKVKSAAQSMSSDVKSATRSMESSVKSATNAVKQMDREVATASSSMEKNLGKVTRQMSAMTAFRIGARGIGMLGGIAENIAKYNGNYESASAIGTATSVAQGGIQGAAAGFLMGGPAGAAVGALVGAGNSLLEAAAMQKEAARELMKGSVKTIEDIEDQYQTRTRQEEIASTASAKTFDSDAAARRIAEAKQAVEDAKARQAAIQDTLYGRNGGINWMDEGQRKALVQQEKERLFGKEGERSWGQAIASWTDPMMDSERDPEKLVANQYKLFAEEAQNAQKEVERAQRLLQELQPLQARIQEEQAKSAKFWMDSQADFWNGEGGKAFDKYQKGGDIQDQIKDSESTISELQKKLQGVVSRPANAPTDALTRIGGGRGYASYNNSTANYQSKVENHLKELIKLEQNKISDLKSELEDIKMGLSRLDPFSTWAS